MKHISIILPLGSSIIDTVIAPYNLLKMANHYYKKANSIEEDVIKVDLVAPSSEKLTYHRYFSIEPTKTLDEITSTDLIIIAAIDGNLIKQIQRNQIYVDWIKKQRIENDAELASLCKGAFLLAETGLVNGKTCSTHWTAHDLFKQRYPKVNLVPEKIISEDNGIYSSGGAYSFLNFTIFLIEKLFDRETAIWCSKISEIEFDRCEQSQFMIFNGQKDHEDSAILKAQEIIEMKYEEKISVDKLANEVHLNSRSFLRRFKKATSNTPLEYIQRVKIEAAKKKLELSTETVSEVMFNVGYNDEKAFRKTFKKYSGLNPSEYQLKYNREMAYN